MSEHTPGPWHVEAEEWTEGRGLLICAPAGPVAVIDPEEAPSAEDEANARLIAAAPEMAAALQAVIDGFMNGDFKRTRPRQSDSDPYHPALVAAKAALRKAHLLPDPEVTATL